MTKKKLGIVRNVSLWAMYDPRSREIASFHKYKKQAPRVPDGWHLIQLKGHYIPVRK